MPAQAIERLYRLTVDGRQANRQLAQINKSTKKIESGFSGMRTAATRAFAAIASLKGLATLVKAADQINLLEGSFEALTGSAERADDMLARVFSTVSDTGASLADVSTTYQRLTVGLEELGSTNEEIEKIADTFIKLGRVSGTSMFDTNAALVQFSQGLASGKLQGDELRSIMERLPLITKLIQEEWNRVNDGMKITRGQVKQLGREGKLSAELISNALLNGAEETARQFSNLTFTLEQELNKLVAQSISSMARLTQAAGLDVLVKESISGLSSALKSLTDEFVGLFQAISTIEEGTKLFSAALLSAATAITVSLAPAISTVLIPAIVAFGVAVQAAFLANPVGIALLGITLAIYGLVKVVQTYLPYFKHRVPEAFYAMKAGIEDALGFDEAAEESFKKAREHAEKYNVALGAIAEGKDWQKVIELNQALKDQADILDEIQTTATRVETPRWDKWIAELDKVGEAARRANDPMIEYNEKLTLLKYAFQNGEIAIEDFRYAWYKLQNDLETDLDKLFPEIDLKDITDKFSDYDANEEYSKSLDDVAESMRHLHDPLLQYTEDLFKMDEALRLNKVSYDEWLTSVNTRVDEMFPEIDISKITAQYQKVQVPVKKTIGLMADLSQAGNHFIEGFATGFADALLDGTKSFSDFAKSILEDLARMIIRAVIFNAIISGLSNTRFGDFLGVGASGGGVATFSNGLSTRATTSDNTSSAGILKPRGYGYGAMEGAAAGGYGNVTINNNTGANVSVEQNLEEGRLDLDIIIENKVNESMSRGGFDKSLQSNYGIKRKGY